MIRALRAALAAELRRVPAGDYFDDADREALTIVGIILAVLAILAGSMILA